MSCPPGHSCIRCYPPKPWQQERLGGASDPDFASLLEREPPHEGSPDHEYLGGPDGTCLWESICGLSEKAHTVGNGPQTRALIRHNQDLSNALSSAAARIKDLEGVLVAIRGKASTSHSMVACQEIISLINETLDPHKPWCRDENHQGPCLSDPEERDDGE